MSIHKENLLFKFDHEVAAIQPHLQAPLLVLLLFPHLQIIPPLYFEPPKVVHEGCVFWYLNLFPRIMNVLNGCLIACTEHLLFTAGPSRMNWASASAWCTCRQALLCYRDGVFPSTSRTTSAASSPLSLRRPGESKGSCSALGFGFRAHGWSDLLSRLLKLPPYQQ